jgi:predicted Zn-dependent peptidase
MPAHSKTLRSLFAASLLTLSLTSAVRADLPAPASIPARPEKLAFPPLQFEPPRADDYRVQLKSGPVAYLVPDRELPLVNIVVYVRAGQYLEPIGKEGVAELTGWLLAHGGAGKKSAAQLEERLAFLAAGLESGIESTRGEVSLNLLAKDVDEGLAILRDVLYAPKFDDEQIKLHKEEMLQGMKQRNDNSESIEEREADYLAYGEKFWSNRAVTAKSLESISRKDLEAFHQRWFAPQNFVVAVSGDFDRAEMTAKLEKLFAAAPFKGEVPPMFFTNTTFAAPGIYVVDKPDVNQGRVSMLLPGIRRDNPDAFAITIMNNILGGGGFTSRIMNRVRSDEGLAYHAGTTFRGGIYFPLPFTAEFQSKNRTVAYAISLIQDEMKKICATPVSDAELAASKNSYLERFPQHFGSKQANSELFADEEFTGRYVSQPDYWKNFRAGIAAVTAADVQRVAQKYLTSEKLVILVVGNQAEILLGHPAHPVKLSELGGQVIDRPLRDPLTLEPLK